LDDVGDQTVEAGGPEVAQVFSAGSPMSAMVRRECQEAGLIEGGREPVVAGAVLSETVCDLHGATRFTGHVAPGVRGDFDFICRGDERGLLNAHRAIITQRNSGVQRRPSRVGR